VIQIKPFKLFPSYRTVLVQTLLTSGLLLSFHASQAAQPLGCLIEPERVVEIGSQVIGVVDKVNVERGDVVRKGQVLATLRADVERASVGVASSRSQVQADIRAAEANLALLQITQKRQETLVHMRFVSEQSLDKARADTEIAKQKLALSREELRTSSSELSLARAQLDQRTIRSPIDGIVTDRNIEPGERVEEKALFRIAKINPLRVEMVVSATSYGSISKGMEFKVVPQLPNIPTLDAKVTLVDKLIDGASNTFRVRAEIQNPNSEIPSGLRCKVELPETEVQNSASISPAAPVSVSPVSASTVAMTNESKSFKNSSKKSIKPASVKP
jgi:membrane fusion protein, heavy metal efflux system